MIWKKKRSEKGGKGDRLQKENGREKGDKVKTEKEEDKQERRRVE